MPTAPILDDPRMALGGEELSLRSAPMQPTTWQEDTRSFEAVLTTEMPVIVYEWCSGELLDEVLRMAGVVLPSTRQVPLLDSHSRYSVRNQLGSIRDFVVDGGAGELRARLYISEAEPFAAMKVREGHVTDVSVGYQNINVLRIEPGQTEMVEGKSYSAGERPLHVVTKWRLLEASLTPIGADELAKVRAAVGNGPAGPGLRDVLSGVSIQKEEKTMADGKKQAPAGEAAPEATSPSPAPDTERTEKVIDLATEAEEARVRSIRAIAPRGLEQMADRLILEKVDVEAARAAFLKALAERTKPVGTPEPEYPQPAAKEDDEKAKAASKLDEIDDEVLVRSLGG